MDISNTIATSVCSDSTNLSLVLHQLDDGTYATHLYNRKLHEFSLGHYHGKNFRSAWYDYLARKNTCTC
jgi:hypothetical protein